MANVTTMTVVGFDRTLKKGAVCGPGRVGPEPPEDLRDPYWRNMYPNVFFYSSMSGSFSERETVR